MTFRWQFSISTREALAALRRGGASEVGGRDTVSFACRGRRYGVSRRFFGWSLGGALRAIAAEDRVTSVWNATRPALRAPGFPRRGDLPDDPGPLPAAPVTRVERDLLRGARPSSGPLGGRDRGLPLPVEPLPPLLLPEDAEALARFMGFVEGNLSKEVRRLHDWKGPMWAERYHSVIVSKGGGRAGPAAGGRGPPPEGSDRQAGPGCEEDPAGRPARPAAELPPDPEAPLLRHRAGPPGRPRAGLPALRRRLPDRRRGPPRWPQAELPGPLLPAIDALPAGEGRRTSPRSGSLTRWVNRWRLSEAILGASFPVEVRLPSADIVWRSPPEAGSRSARGRCAQSRPFEGPRSDFKLPSTEGGRASWSSLFPKRLAPHAGHLMLHLMLRTPSPIGIRAARIAVARTPVTTPNRATSP